MRQKRRGQVLSEALERSFNVMVRIEARESGDVNAPGWDSDNARRGVQLVLSQASSRELQLAQDRNYPQPLTHIAYLEDIAELAIGSRMIETHYRTDTGRWQMISSTEAETVYLIIGRQRIAGMPEPRNQVKVYLHQVTASRGR